MKLSEGYRTRPVHFLDYWHMDQWRLKVYGITYQGTAIDPALVEATREVAVQRLAESATSTNHYGVGFVGIHAGKTANFVFVDWWADENELHHHVYASPSAAPANLVYKTRTGPIACTSDLFVMDHERDSWVENVLKKSEDPDIEGYLAAQLDTAV